MFWRKESQNIWGWKGHLQVISSKTPAQQGHLEPAVQYYYEMGFEYLQGWRLHKPSLIRSPWPFLLKGWVVTPSSCLTDAPIPPHQLFHICARKLLSTLQRPPGALVLSLQQVFGWLKSTMGRRACKHETSSSLLPDYTVCSRHPQQHQSAL